MPTESHQTNTINQVTYVQKGTANTNSICRHVDTALGSATNTRKCQWICFWTWFDGLAPAYLWFEGLWTLRVPESDVYHCHKVTATASPVYSGSSFILLVLPTQQHCTCVRHRCERRRPWKLRY